MMKIIALTLTLLAFPIASQNRLYYDHAVTKKQLINAIHRLDVEAVSRLASTGQLAHINMVEVFKELSVVEQELQKTINIKAAVKTLVGLACMAVAGNFIYKSYTLNEDNKDSFRELFWRLIYARPGKVLAVETTPNVFNLPLIAFSGSLFTCGAWWTLGGYSSLYKTPLDMSMQQRLCTIVHILMSSQAEADRDLLDSAL